MFDTVTNRCTLEANGSRSISTQAVEAMVDEMLASSPLLKLAAGSREAGGKQKVDAAMLTMLGGAAVKVEDGTGLPPAPPAPPETTAAHDDAWKAMDSDQFFAIALALHDVATAERESTKVG